MLQKSHQIDRSKVNLQEVNARELGKSGFDMSYTSYNDYVLGRLHVGGYQHTMPGDSFRGRNSAQLTFNKLVTPVLSPVEVCSHNFYMPYRAVDATFEEAFAPSALNAMSASWTVPSFTLRSLIQSICLLFNTSIGTIGDSMYKILSATGTDPNTLIEDITDAALKAACEELVNSSVISINQNHSSFTSLYMVDEAVEYNQYLNLSHIVRDGSLLDCIRYILNTILPPFIGRMSLLDEFGFNYLRSYDIDYIVNNVSSLSSALSLIDDTPLCEYPFRVYYAIWYEYYRDVNLEKRSSTLPNYKQFGSTSIVANNPVYLLHRTRSWAKDPFISSLPDDPFRHVFAPILTSVDGEGEDVTRLNQTYNYLNAEGSYNMGTGSGQYENNHGINSQKLYYVDENGSKQTLVCPLPTIVNDVLTNGDNVEYAAYRLDLCNLKRSQMLERYLKRNFYFGDEYRDRMLAHYNSQVSDNRVNRPHLLSSSVSSINTDQMVSSQGYGDVLPGQRTVTATAGLDDDTYTFFGEEFGMVLNLVSVMPKPQYAGLCPVLLQSKVVDFPVPEFAGQMAELGRIMEIATSGLAKDSTTKATFGHYPYGHAYRSRVNEVHGSYLDDKADYTFRRFFGLDDPSTTPKLNYMFIHCRPNLGMFEDSVRYDGQLYGSIQHDFFVERVLPTPVEEI